MTPPFRADHVGSLLRPRELHEARAKAKKGELTAAELKAVQDRCIRDVVALQEAAGFRVTPRIFNPGYPGLAGITSACNLLACVRILRETGGR